MDRDKHLPAKPFRVTSSIDQNADAIIVHGDVRDILLDLKRSPIRPKLIITSPPYNVGKAYETRKPFEEYLAEQKEVIEGLVDVMHSEGSLCWQVGNYVEKGEVFPLDIFFYPIFKGMGLKLRNRIIWHFGHGLHAKRRFSGRYEVLLWFTASDNYTFNLDAVRVPSKYPGKRYYKGPKKGRPSTNPKGKNPSDLWKVAETDEGAALKIVTNDWVEEVWDIPNVKANHPEKTDHPAQFPIELVERCVLALTDPGDWVFDPYMGVGSSIIAALKRGRRAIGVDIKKEYVEKTKERIWQLQSGLLKYRPLGKPVYAPKGTEKVATPPPEWKLQADDDRVKDDDVG